MNTNGLWLHWQTKTMNDLLTDADLCVKCGLCLPYCPTYTHTQNENESPRGRIALIQAWAGQKLEASDELVEHIDNCLLCRSCERACPAAVPYGRLVDNFRSQVSHQRKSSLRVSLIKKVAHNQSARRFAQKTMRLYQTSPLQQTARLLGLPRLLRLQALDRLLPAWHGPMGLENLYTATTDKQGDVGLFVGCMGEWLDQETVRAAIAVLNAVGFDVHVPKQQVCCGALALHDGDQTTAAHLAEANASAFGGQELDAVISIASGCGGQLKEYQQRGFSDKVMDISHFLSQFSSMLSGKLKPLPEKVCIHTPCSLKNVLRTEQSVSKLLGQIPEIALVPLPDTVQCCGSAGSYMLDHPQMAEALLSDVLESALQKQPETLVSSNIGCALHIAAGLRERGLRLEVLHPVVLIARQL